MTCITRSHTCENSELQRECDGDDAAENCPVWLGQGRRVHLGFPDPAKATGNDEEVMAVLWSVRDAIAE